jgi:cobalamin biosynthesis Mg chelatase CobN
MKTLDTLEKLEQIYPFVNATDNSTNEQIQSLIVELTRRLQYMEDLMINASDIEHSIKEIFQKPSISPLQAPFITFKLRELCSTFEIGLKYSPQMYFETLKLLRHLWYTYEESLAVN